MRTPGHAFDAGVPRVIIHAGNMVKHLQVFGRRFKCSHKMGKNGALHRMLEARDTVHFPIFVNSLYGALFLAHKTVGWASSVILLRDADRSQGRCCNDTAKKQSWAVRGIEEQPVLAHFAYAGSFTCFHETHITPEVAPPGDIIRESSIDGHSYLALLFNHIGRLHQNGVNMAVVNCCSTPVHLFRFSNALENSL
jgi:hypothetical protein